MKKFYLLIFGIVSLFGISTVKADTELEFNYAIDYTTSDSYSISNYKSFINNHSYIINSAFSSFFSDYESYKSDYPYYLVSINTHDTSDRSTIELNFYIFNSIPSNFNISNPNITPNLSSRCSINAFTDTISSCTSLSQSSGFMTRIQTLGSKYYYYPYFFSNFKLYYNDSSIDSLLFNVTNTTGTVDFNTSFLVSISSPIPTIYEEFEFTFLSSYITDSYIEINLNDYNYVILSLKDYSVTSQFNSIIYTLGSLCLTPVYDYGMKEKKFYYTDYQTPACSETYTQFTPVNLYILSQDIQNHAVYYIKSSNIYVNNIIKIDSDIFDITYISSSNANNPSVLIGGRSYPTIPYSQLTDTAIISSEQGYISGSTCAIGDINCESSSMGLDISDIFTNPLKVLQSVWGAITSVFLIISSFMTVLPLPLQTFLYVSFMIGFVLGIIKIIL